MTSWDLTLFLVTDGQDWSRYVEGQLDKTPKVRRQSLLMDQMLYENPPELTLACQQSAVVLLLVTPELVDFMESKAGWFSKVLQQIQSTSSIVCFLLLDQQDSDRLVKVAGESYVSADWVYFDPGYEVLEVLQTIAQVLDIVEKCQTARSQKQKEKELEAAPQTKPRVRAEETAPGSKTQTVASCRLKTAPKSKSQTVPESQPEEIYDEPVSSTTIQDERSLAAASIRPKKMPPPPTQKKSPSVVQFFPSVVHESGVHVAMVFKEEVRGDITLKVELTDIQLIPERENDKVFTFLAPAGCSAARLSSMSPILGMLIPQSDPPIFDSDALTRCSALAPGKHKMLIMEGDRRLAHCTMTMKGADVDGVFCSTQFLCQSLQVLDLTHLDMRLKEMFSASLPKAGSGLDKIFNHLSISDDTEQVKQSEAVYPTLLHYAAAHGLSEFCSALLECPGSSMAYHIQNCDGLDPAELAAKGGYQELENYIIDFMEMQTANEIYDHYFAMHSSQDPDSDSSDGEDYEDMNAQSFPPPSRARSLSTPSVGVSVLSTWSPSPPPPVTSRSGAGRTNRPPLPPPRQGQSIPPWTPSVAGPLGVISEVEQKASTLPATPSPAKFMDIGSFQPKLSKGAMGSRSQNELIEVHEMVKSHEINVNEARMLFNAWQQRYGKTPSRSFRERQKELTDIQTQYNKVREVLNEEGKSSKSFFTRLGLGGRQKKPTVKVHITDPVVQRQRGQQKFPKVYTKSASTSNLFSDRASSASTASSSSSSRDSGWSQGSRDSQMSSSHECDSEKEEVFQPQGILRRSSSARDATKRDSLGHQYLREAEEELKKEATPPPPILPPRNRPLPLPPSSLP